MPAIMHVAHSSGASLPHDLGCEVDLVMRRTNARAELHDEVFRSGAADLAHLLDRARNDAEFGAFPARVDEPDEPRAAIHEIDRSAIRHINREADSRRRRDQSIDAWDSDLLIDDRNVAAVHLLGSRKGLPGEAEVVSSLAMHTPEPRERGLPVGDDIDAPRTALDESRAEKRQRIERRERFDRTERHEFVFFFLSVFLSVFFGLEFVIIGPPFDPGFTWRIGAVGSLFL